MVPAQERKTEAREGRGSEKREGSKVQYYNEGKKDKIDKWALALGCQGIWSQGEGWLVKAEWMRVHPWGLGVRAV